MKPCNDKGCLDYIHHKFFCNCQCELGRKMTESQFYAKQGKVRQAVTKKGGGHKMKKLEQLNSAIQRNRDLELNILIKEENRPIDGQWMVVRGDNGTVYICIGYIASVKLAVASGEVWNIGIGDVLEL